MYGPLQVSYKELWYIPTAVDMFSKLIFMRAISTKDALTVSTGFIELFTTIGVHQTLISD